MPERVIADTLVVIMARTVCPFSLNAVALSANAGRRFVSVLSVKGKGTTTTSHGLEITECLFVFRGGPFVERIRESRMKCSIKGLDMLHCNDTVMNIIGDRVSGFHADSFTNFFWNGHLTLMESLLVSMVKPPLLFTVKIA